MCFLFVCIQISAFILVVLGVIYILYLERIDV